MAPTPFAPASPFLAFRLRAAIKNGRGVREVDAPRPRMNQPALADERHYSTSVMYGEWEIGSRSRFRWSEVCGNCSFRDWVSYWYESYSGSYRDRYILFARTSLRMPFLNCAREPKNFSSVDVVCLSWYLRAASSTVQM